MSHMKPIESRNTARDARRETKRWQGEYHVPVETWCASNHMSKVHMYRIIEELEEWEKTATFEQEAAEINAQWPEYHPDKIPLMSGPMILAYIHAEISSALLNDGEREPIGVEPEADPLLD